MRKGRIRGGHGKPAGLLGFVGGGSSELRGMRCSFGFRPLRDCHTCVFVVGFKVRQVFVVVLYLPLADFELDYAKF